MEQLLAVFVFLRLYVQQIILKIENRRGFQVRIFFGQIRAVIDQLCADRRWGSGFFRDTVLQCRIFRFCMQRCRVGRFGILGVTSKQAGQQQTKHNKHGDEMFHGSSRLLSFIFDAFIISQMFEQEQHVSAQNDRFRKFVCMHKNPARILCRITNVKRHCCRKTAAVPIHHSVISNGQRLCGNQCLLERTTPAATAMTAAAATIPASAVMGASAGASVEGASAGSSTATSGPATNSIFGRACVSDQ